MQLKNKIAIMILIFSSGLFICFTFLTFNKQLSMISWAACFGSAYYVYLKITGYYENIENESWEVKYFHETNKKEKT